MEKITIKIKEELAKKLEDLLERTKIDFHEEKIAEDAIISMFTAEFSNGFWADIKVCSGQNNCFLDPVLFDENGSQICTLDTEAELLGEYIFTFEDVDYAVVLELV